MQTIARSCLEVSESLHESGCATARTISGLVFLILIISHVLEANGKIEYHGNGLCKFGCEVKVVSEKLGFSRGDIFNGNVIAVHLDLQQMEISSPELLNLQHAWNTLRPF